MVYSIHDFKMAKSSWNHENFARGWARVLLDATDFFERRRRELNTIGRSGIAPQNQTRTPSIGGNRYSRQGKGHFPHRRVGALAVMEQCMGAFPHGGEEVEASLLPPSL